MALPLASPAEMQADTRELSGWVGAHQLAFSVRPVADRAQFAIEPTQADFVAITEVYPESAEPVAYHYLVTGPGLAPFERCYAAQGFGPVTYFLRVDHQPAGPVTIANLGNVSDAPGILGVRAITRDDLARIRQEDHFTLMGTVINSQLGMSEDAQAARIAERLAAEPGRRMDRAFSCEIYYASNDADGVRRQLETARQRARQHSLPAFLGLVSWWGGTPQKAPDGLGGKFGDLRYQQICYTPNSDHPENAELREFLGSRYNSHYCLTTPNIWSNTPWLTMNSPQLNAYRFQRLREAVDLLNEVCRGDASWIAGVFLENEPRYWDTQSSEGTPQGGGERWADFNPCVIAAAARDGVALDPADGMAIEELAWLQRNVGRYFQETVDVFRQRLEFHQLHDPFPVYTHSLQLARLFPGVLINRTPSDWARAAGARTGIEGIWSQPSDYDRVREWGPWCNLNREETDGTPISVHLWDLRTSFAMGAECYNSYNWHTLKDDAYFRYASDFLEELPVVTRAPVRAVESGPDRIAFTPPGDLQAFTSVVVPVGGVPGPAASTGGTVALAVDGGPDRTWFSQRQPLPDNGRCLLTFVFPVPAQANWSSGGTIRLHSYDADGAEAPGTATFSDDAAQQLRLACDLSQCRALSRLVIRWRQAAPR